MIELFPSRVVALSLFGFEVHWYGVLYVLAFLTAFFLLPKLLPFRKLEVDDDDLSSIMTWAILGVIVGGRLGYVLFYAPAIIFQDPLEIFRVWHGGMSSHGGFIGTLLALFFVLRKKGVPFYAFMDIAVIVVAIGLAYGRIGNFINQELYGTVTTLPWGISIPGVEGLRHPTHLYAVLKDLFIASACFWYVRLVRPIIPGRSGALFLMLYGVLRFLNEYLRVQDFPSTDLGIISLTRGQLLTVPIFLAGAILWFSLGRQQRAHH